MHAEIQKIRIPRQFAAFKPKLFARGKRSLVFIFRKNKTLLALKIEKPGTKAKNKIKNEAEFLKLLNKYSIGPRLISAKNNYICYKFVKGKPLQIYLAESKNPLAIIKKLLYQCRKLDKLKINKLELHKPLKHIYIHKNKPVMIDFERCYSAQRPKNITQFFQYLLSQKQRKLQLNRKKLISVLKVYKNDQSEKNFKTLLSNFKIN